MRQTIIFLIKIYKKTISPFLTPCCRFYPTCSTYSLLAFEKFGISKGTILSIKRILKCHPFHPGGIDPAPEKGRSKNGKKTTVDNGTIHRSVNTL